MMESLDEIREIMESAPGGENHGRAKKDAHHFDEDDEDTGSNSLVRYLSTYSHEALQNLAVSAIPKRDMAYHGMVAHRGVLSDREYEFLDWDRVEAWVEERMGASIETINELFGPGRPNVSKLLDKEGMEDRLLSIQREGGNMTALAAVFGWRIRDNGECRTMSKALTRARRRERDRVR